MRVITLLTDFGTGDYFVGAMKGVMLSINESLAIIDISHDVPPQSISSGSFILQNSYKHFPAGSIHVAIVDPGVGSSRRALLVATEDHFFLAPDNGLLSFIFLSDRNLRIFSLENERYFLPNRSNTFHGRDIFAPVAAHLSKGISPEEFGPQIDDPIISSFPSPKMLTSSLFSGEIIHIDRFGNLITNFHSSQLPKRFSLKIGNYLIQKHQTYYAEALTDEIFSIIGSSGFLEISVLRGSAQKRLGASVGNEVILEVHDKDPAE